jgi:hypothetical protein
MGWRLGRSQIPTPANQPSRNDMTLELIACSTAIIIAVWLIADTVRMRIEARIRKEIAELRKPKDRE